MIKIIKLANSGLAPGGRAGAEVRVDAVWGVEVNGQVAARIFTICGAPTVVEANTGRVLYSVLIAAHRQNRVAIAKDWALKHFAAAC